MSSSSAYVEDAADMSKAMTWADTRCPGDYQNAMERAARRAGVSSGLFWRLHYRKPKAIDTADFMAIGAAYGKQRKTGRERTAVTPRTALGRFLVGIADSLDSFGDSLVRSNHETLD